MALVSCQSCGHKISDKAVKCPKCGIRVVAKENIDNKEKIVGHNPRKTKMTIMIISFIILIISVLATIVYYDSFGRYETHEITKKHEITNIKETLEKLKKREGL